MPIYTKVKTVRKTIPASGCGLRTDLGELHSNATAQQRHTVVDCGQTLVSYTVSHRISRRELVVDCGQTLVSYTSQSAPRARHTVVDCGQTLVSYTWRCGGSAIRSCGLRTDLGELHLRQAQPSMTVVVDCGQTLVSYTRPDATRWNRGGFALQIDYKSSIWRGAGSGGLRFSP